MFRSQQCYIWLRAIHLHTVPVKWLPPAAAMEYKYRGPLDTRHHNASPTLPGLLFSNLTQVTILEKSYYLLYIPIMVTLNPM